MSTKKIKVYYYEDEMYPVHYLDLDSAYRDYMEISPRLYTRYKKAMKEFHAVQKLLGAEDVYEGEWKT